MKPVGIFRHSPGEGPGYFATFLERHSLPFRVIRVDAGDVVPDTPEAFGGLCFMGGPMSVNDDLPWIAPTLALIRAAVASDIPVLGHCLGGQLMAKAMGGSVGRNAVKEIGWGDVEVLDNPVARAWFGETAASRKFTAFHWHGETFTIPRGAAHLLSSAACAHQAFALGPHLGLQCHVEMTAAMIAQWGEVGADEIAAAGATSSVQQPAAMLEDIEARLAAMHAVADRLYGRWIEGLRRDEINRGSCRT